MVNLEEPPLRLLSEIEERLGAEGIKLSLTTDLPEEKDTKEHLILTEEHLAIIKEEAGKKELKKLLSLKDIEEIRSLPLVGCGVLEAKVKGEWVRLIRYSNVLAPQFAVAARDVSLLKEGKKEMPPEEEERRCPKCGLPLPPGSKVCPRCLPKGQVLKRLLTYAKPYKWSLIIAGLISLLITALNLLPIYINRYLMDKVFVPADAHFHKNLSMSPAELKSLGYTLGLMVLALLFVNILSTALTVLRGRITVRTGQRIVYDLRSSLFKNLQHLSVTFYDRYPTGSLISRITQDTGALQGFLANDVYFFAVNILLLIGISAILLQMNWRLALLTLIPAPFILLLVGFVWGYIYMNFRRLWHRWSRFVSVLSDSLSGIRVVKAFAQEKKEEERFDKRASALFEAATRAEQTQATFTPILSFLISSTSLIVLYFGGRDIVGGQISTGTLFAFLSALGMLFGPLQVVMNMSNSIANALAASERVFEIMDMEAEELNESEEKVSLPYIYGNVEFRNVTFGYDKHQPILHNINLKVRAGEMVGIVGPSGAGKTTIINLICRFYLPTEGEILIDGVNIKDINLRDLRRQIGLVPQEPFLFRGTIAENIAYSRFDARPEEIIRAAKAANAHHFITYFPEGYDTVVGERGARLSGGERQRIAIARALVHNPRILILDEATSAVDTEAEKQIQEALSRLVRGRTTFAIAHRLSTLRIADRIVVLKGGRIVEQGTNEELLSRDGEYKKLVELQAGPISGPEQWAVKREEIEEMDIGPLFFPPNTTKFERTSGGVVKLYVEGMGEFSKVILRRLFPLSNPTRYISVWNGDYRSEEQFGQEIGVITDLEMLDPESRQVVEEELERTYYIAKIKRIKSVKDLYGFTEWVVETDIGERKFLTWGLHNSVIDMGNRRLIIWDIDNIYYEIEDWTRLDPRSLSYIRRVL
ncbi:DUF1854 domain-containing protein [bacterium]|nr:DUF1854 domain-containing protein [bacterium]